MAKLIESLINTVNYEEPKGLIGFNQKVKGQERLLCVQSPWTERLRWIREA